MAERSKFVVMMREEEMKAAILRAEGESQAASLVAEAISKFGPGLIAMRKIEAAQHIVEALQANPNITFLSGNALNMVNIPGAGN
jgi:prohibitin 1